MSPQLLSCLLACLALMAFCVTVDSDDPVMLAVSTISMSLQVRHATSFCLEALRAKKNSWDTPASIAPSTGPIQYTCRLEEHGREVLIKYKLGEDIGNYLSLSGLCKTELGFKSGDILFFFSYCSNDFIPKTSTIYVSKADLSVPQTSIAVQRPLKAISEHCSLF